MNIEAAIETLKSAFHKTRTTKDVSVNARALGTVLYPVANDNELDTPAQARAIAINDLVDYFHGKSTANGWWSEADKANPMVAPAKLMLIVSEIAEAMEGHRKNLMDDKLPSRRMVEVELGDALIRICDLAGHLGLDLGGATMEKAAYNDNRTDHKAAARAAAGGKAY